VDAAIDDWFRLQEALRIPDPSVVNAPITGLHGGRSGVLRSGDEVVGDVGEVPRAVLDGLGIEQEVAWLGLDLDVIEGLERPAPAYRLVSRHPSSDVDLAFDVADTVPAAAVDAVLHEAGGALLVDLWLFDVFRGPSLGEGRRSLAYGLRFQAADRTLTADDVALARQACIDAVESAFDARLRA
jgi:phenylalanyl-tRNA synthetase beta chain